MSDISAVRANARAYPRPVLTEQRVGTNLAVVSHSNPDPLSRTTPAGSECTDKALASNNVDGIAVSPPAIRQQLAHMLQSPIFIHSDKLSRFLRFIVEHVIRGNQNYLKEYVIGSEVYDRRHPYHPSQDSIVRTEARRLRGKLKEYYETEGKDDAVYIYLRPGNYIPVFRHSANLIGAQGVVDAGESSLLAKTSILTIGILPFRDVSSTPPSSRYARGIPDELAYSLMRNQRCRVMPACSMGHVHANELDVLATMRKIGAHIAVEGSVKAQGAHVRITVRMIDAAGFQLWTKRFDVEANAQTVFATEEEIATALSLAVNTIISTSRHLTIVRQHGESIIGNSGDFVTH